MNAKLKSSHQFPSLEIKRGQLKESLWTSSKSYTMNTTPQCTVRHVVNTDNIHNICTLQTQTILHNICTLQMQMILHKLCSKNSLPQDAYALQICDAISFQTNCQMTLLLLASTSTTRCYIQYNLLCHFLPETRLQNVTLLSTALLTFWRRNYFFNFSTLCI